MSQDHFIMCSRVYIICYVILVLGRPLMKVYIFESDCKDCIIMMETQDVGEHQFKRMMLYGKVLHSLLNRAQRYIHAVTSMF